VTQRFTDGKANYHALETAFSKRFSQRWQASATYTLSQFKDANPVPLLPGCDYPMSAPGVCNVPISNLRPDLGGEYGLAVGDQRHRAVFNGIWEMPYAFQVSGLFFFGSGQRFPTTYGGDLANSAGFTARLRPNGSVVPRNDFVGKPLYRADLRVLRRLSLWGHAKADGMIEIFNAFNHANYGSYTTAESSRAYGLAAQNVAIEYQPRMVQLGFRLSF
jgi:hypothetical protein